MAGQWQGQLPPLQVIKICVPSLPSHRCDLKPDVNHLVRPRPVGKTTTIPVPCPRPFARAPPSEERPFARPCLLAPLSGHASFIPTLRGTWHLPETKSRSACRAEGKALGRGRSGRATPALAQGGDGPFRALRSPSERTRCNRVGPALLRAEPLFTPGGRAGEGVSPQRSGSGWPRRPERSVAPGLCPQHDRGARGPGGPPDPPPCLARASQEAQGESDPGQGQRPG